MADRRAAGLWQPRPRDPSTAGGVKLTWASVDAIREQLAAGTSSRELASYYGVSMSLISLIARGRAWRELHRR